MKWLTTRFPHAGACCLAALCAAWIGVLPALAQYAPDAPTAQAAPPFPPPYIPAPGPGLAPGYAGGYGPAPYAQAHPGHPGNSGYPGQMAHPGGAWGSLSPLAPPIYGAPPVGPVSHAYFSRATPLDYQLPPPPGWSERQAAYYADPAQMDPWGGRGPLGQPGPGYGVAPVGYAQPGGYCDGGPGCDGGFGHDPFANPYEEHPGGRPMLGWRCRPGAGHNVSAGFSPNPDNPVANFLWNAQPYGLVKSFEAGAYVNEDQAVFSAGAVFALWERDYAAIAARVLGTSIVYHDLGEFDFGISCDLYGSHRCDILGNTHYLKFGWFFDGQNGLTRTGPAFGGLLFTDDTIPPLTFDVTLGFGGDPAVINGERRVSPDEEVQLRCGVQFTDWCNFGFRGVWAHWNDPQFQSHLNTIGAYTQLDFGRWALNLDIGAGDSAQGFANFVYYPGQPILGHVNGGMNATRVMHTNREHRWLTQPVMRDLTIRSGKNRVVNEGRVVGNLTDVFAIVRFDGVDTQPDAGAPPNGVVDDGEGFEVDIAFRNGTDVLATNVFFANSGLIGPAILVAGTVDGSFPVNVPPRSSVRTPGGADPSPDIDIDVVGAADGDFIFVECDVSADGQTRRFRFGPFEVGNIRDGSTYRGTAL